MLVDELPIGAYVKHNGCLSKIVGHSKFFVLAVTRNGESYFFDKTNERVKTIRKGVFKHKETDFFFYYVDTTAVEDSYMRSYFLGKINEK